MAAVTRDRILSTWNALAGTETAGWRSIDFFEAGACRVKLARRFPDDKEAVLIGFTTLNHSKFLKFPSGQGFRMERAALGGTDAAYYWLALIRQPAGGIELFATVVADVARLLITAAGLPEPEQRQLLLGRVWGWQEFMRKGRDGLSEEAEQGLYAELHLLITLFEMGLQVGAAVGSWKGPFDGLHDFVFPEGVIEVKSTISQTGFLIKVGSLDQLDSEHVAKLYLAAVRLSTRIDGSTLVEIISKCRERLAVDPSAHKLFENALLNVGFLDVHATKYERRFSVSEFLVFSVDADFPRLARSNVPMAIRRAQYEVDLAVVDSQGLSLIDVTSILGVF